MRSPIDRRLAALERCCRPAKSSRVIVYKIVEPDRSLSPVIRYESSDGRSWARAPGEAVAVFIERASAEAARFTMGAALALMPQLESER